MRILFMGSPDFALVSLEALCRAGENVVGVVTQTDKPKGRGYALTPPPVKAYAQEAGIPVYQPKTLRGEEFAKTLAEISPDLIVVVAFGKLLPENVIAYPKYGCINVHGSLLPRYRGAAPMQRAIMEGERVTGITTMMMDVGLDTGDMLLSTPVDILAQDDFETLHDKLALCGAKTLLATIAALRAGTLVRQKQNDALSTYAAKIEKADCLLDFNQPAKLLWHRIRGLSPAPLAFTHTPDGNLLKVLSATVEYKDIPAGVVPGTVISLDDGKISVATGEGILCLRRVLPQGKARMDAADFIRGRKISVGDLLA